VSRFPTRLGEVPGRWCVTAMSPVWNQPSRITDADRPVPPLVPLLHCRPPTQVSADRGGQSAESTASCGTAYNGAR
jgi:hypothetical protein